jgi:hypothetical protein
VFLNLFPETAKDAMPRGGGYDGPPRGSTTCRDVAEIS